MKRTLALFLVLLMALSLCACGGGDTPLTKEELLENAGTVTINRLGEDFRNNVIAAKDTYVGKAFIVPGVVNEIKEDGCILYYETSVPSNAYFVKANIPVDDLKNLNIGDLIHVVGIIVDGVETVEKPIQDSTFIRNYITMENAYFVDKITELSGTVHVSSGSVIYRYIEVPFLTGDSDKIKLLPRLAVHWGYGFSSLSDFEELVSEGAKVTISISDIRSDGYGSTRTYEVGCTPDIIKVEKAGE